MGKDVELDFCLDGEVLEDFSDFKGIFIYILFAIQDQGPQPL